MNSEVEQLYYYKKIRLFEVDFMGVRLGKIEELVQVTYDFTATTTKQYNREIVGLIKGAQLTGCSNLLLIIMNGQSQTIESIVFSVRCVRAIDWLLNKDYKRTMILFLNAQLYLYTCKSFTTFAISNQQTTIP